MRSNILTRTGGKYQRPGKDHDPIRPFMWATMVGQEDPVQVLSYPIPAGQDGVIDEATATIMVRTQVGDPGSLREVPLRAVACFDESRHPWASRSRVYVDDGIDSYYFKDGL